MDRPLHLLLVEDSAADADLVRELLVADPRTHYHVDHVVRLADAIEKVEESRVPVYDVALLDFHLPDSAGFETFARLHVAAPHLPIVVLTNLEDDEIAARAVREGAQDYLLKSEAGTRLLTRTLRYAVERTASEQALRDSEERYALAVAGAKDGLWDWHLAAASLYVSPRWAAMLGLRPEDLRNEPAEWLKLVHPDDREGFEAALAAHLSGDSVHFEHEHRMRQSDGNWIWMLTRGLAVRDAAGEAVRMAGSMTDISDRKRAEDQLLHDALHDGLTSLPNRALFTDRLGLALRRRRRDPSEQFAVLFLDLDRFKTVNDSLGHSIGDALLGQLAERLAGSLRPGDTVARLGGDEFAFLIHGVASPAGASHIAGRIQDLVGQRFEIEGHEVFTTASIGIALSASGYLRPEEILRDADIAMYRAKAAGKARYEVFDREMHRAAVTLLKLETELRRAVAEQQFVTEYQPIVSLESGRILGFETLVRWCHPERGLVRPQHFIAVAEETGLIVPLGWWVLKEACRQIAAWQKRFPAQPLLSISCNVSGRLFRSGSVVDRMVGLLEQNRLQPESLRLEITENVVLDQGESVLSRLTELRALGVEIQIDDFGTGYSSLSYLQRFRYDALKIDRSFVSGLGRPGDGEAIVQSILDLGRNLDMMVIAEGVETAGQARRLRELNCPQGQGYWFARPLAPAAAEKLLIQQHDLGTARLAAPGPARPVPDWVR